MQRSLINRLKISAPGDDRRVTFAKTFGLPTKPWHPYRNGRELKIGHERPDIRRGVV